MPATIEIHLLDFRENVYSLQLKIEVIEFIRKDQKFDSIDEMIWQIKEDEKQIKKSLTLFHLTEANFKKNPSVAVVILNYNGAHFLNNYLQSIITHTPNYATIYVIDNASTDDSILLLKQKYPEIKRIILHKNYGYAEGYNKGLAQITADYFVLINSDIQVSDDWLSPLIQRIQSDPFNMAVQPKILALNDPQSFEYAGAAGGLMDALGYTFSYGRMLNKVEKDKYTCPNITTSTSKFHFGFPTLLPSFSPVISSSIKIVTHVIYILIKTNGRQLDGQDALGIKSILIGKKWLYTGKTIGFIRKR